ncbi:TonB-dependent receptor [Roseococcus sp. SDR]|uniref:TonB-dependent receptor family protein n=1 Tax=Roseococcus sp. SDR TaxID=2835532 RepID=UPI001BD17DBF|nr:TonB-dependent receptor [Roseococcus sp. SDR]MBS7789535.1 TonB-dependent receptor [Roseococcus sp. SDR]MBV1844849.1 TonB-dependent receptor [Roseococcus sp. SDR]
MSLLRRALLSAPLIASPAFAQTEIRAHPDTVVTATPPPLTSESNNEARLRLWLSPGNNTVVPASEFQDRPGVLSLRDMFEFTPGVFAQPKWGEDSRLSIRGSGIARNFHLRGVRVFQDGIPINQADGSGDLQELDPTSFLRAEVFRGGNGFALGANTLGGAINFVTPTARQQEGQGVTFRLEGGSRGFIRGNTQMGGVFGAWDGWVSGTMLNQDGWRNHSSGSAGRMNSNGAYRWAENAETRVYFTYNAIQQDIPGTVTRNSATQTPRLANPANVQLNYQRNIESYRLGTITAIRPNAETLVELGGSYVQRQLDHPIFQYIDNHTNDFNLFGRVTWDGSLGGFRNRLVAGVNAAWGTNDNRRFVNLSGVRGAQTFASWDTASTTDAYFENSFYVLPELALVAGLSGGQAVRRSENRLNASLSGSGDWGFINPRAGLLWQATSNVQAYANVTWSTEPPTLSDLVALVPLGGFRLLAPQRAITAEIGTRGTVGDFTFDGAYYYSWLKDEIQLFAGQQPGTSFARNADKTVHQGVELAASYVAGRNLFTAQDSMTLRGAYTFSAFNFDNDRLFGNNQLPGVPPHVLRAEARYRHPSGWWVAPNVDWVPEGFYVDNANTRRTDSYTLLGLRAGAELMDGRLGLFAEGRNLLNSRFISSASVTPIALGNPALYEPGIGTTAYAGMLYRF